MAHNVLHHSFSRRPAARKALVKGLVIALVEHERIKTTLAKAKELRRHVEKAITLGKSGTDAAKRLLEGRLSNRQAAEKIVSNLSKRFQSRPGGYTRILKAGRRPGDLAPMAIIEFVDYVLPVKEGETAGDKKAVQAKPAKKKAPKAAAAAGAKKAKAPKKAKATEEKN